MKVTVNVECTPEEARQYMGLPDVTVMNEKIMEKMGEQMTTMGPESFMTVWEPFFKNMSNFWTTQYKGK